MSRKVDISEVVSFSDDLQRASEDIRTTLIKVKKRIETINGMNSFSGKAADEAKKYFSELHLTIIESFRGVFDDLEKNLQQHIDTFESDVDRGDDVVINSDYLEEIKEDMNDVFEKLKEQDESIHDTIEDVTDISAAAPPSFSDIDEWKGKATNKLKELDEDLTSFTGESDETDAKAIMEEIEAAINSAKTSEGKERFSDFEGASESSELAKLQDYNAEKKEERKEEVSSLKEKLKDGESLTYTEREILYQHIQKEELDEKDKEHVEKVNSYIKEDNEKLKKHLNDEVLTSEKSLEEEIILFEKYLFAGNKGPSHLYGGSDENRTALRNYLETLKNHHTTINEVKESMDWNTSKDDPLLARVEDVQFSDHKGENDSEGQSVITPHKRMKSDITVEHEQDINKSKVYDSREDFLEAPIRPGYRPGYGNKSEVDYYYGPDAVTDHNEKVKQELDGELDAMTGEFAGSELLGNSLNLAGTRWSIAGNLFMGFSQHAADKKEKEDRLKWKTQEGPANKFGMEMQVNKRESLERSEDKQIKLHPTDETYEKMERWKAIHRKEPDFPYDGEAITKQNWQEMYELFYDSEGNEKLSEDDKYSELNEYMINGQQENKKIKYDVTNELMNENYKNEQ